MLLAVHLSELFEFEVQNHKLFTTMRYQFFCSALLLLASLHLHAQGEPRFYAEASPLEVAVGEPIRISFKLENGHNAARFSPPDWAAAGFVQLGSSQSSNLSIVNGQSTASIAYMYTITPIETGVLTIPALSIRAGEQVLSTEPIQIQATGNPDGLRPSSPQRAPATPTKPDPRSRIKTIKM